MRQCPGKAKGHGTDEKRQGHNKHREQGCSGCGQCKGEGTLADRVGEPMAQTDLQHVLTIIAYRCIQMDTT